MKKSEIVLPRFNEKEGTYYISYSQVTAWNAIKSFTLGIPGKEEYIRSYFLKEMHPEGGFATFGKDVEDYICSRDKAETFTNDEKAVLDSIKPLGTFQREFKIKRDGYYVLGYIDDANEDLTKIRDYKTASKASAKKYYTDEYEQLDIYAMAIKEEIGRCPDELEVCVIERSGNGFKGGREALKVAGEVWYINRETSDDKMARISHNIERTVKEISEVYKVFLKLNKI